MHLLVCPSHQRGSRERPLGAKDEVKRLEGPPARSRGPQTSSFIYIMIMIIFIVIVMITQWHKSVGTVPGGEIGCQGACFTITELTRSFDSHHHQQHQCRMDHYHKKQGCRYVLLLHHHWAHQVQRRSAGSKRTGFSKAFQIFKKWIFGFQNFCFFWTSGDISERRERLDIRWFQNNQVSKGFF